jgi:cobalamin 5'-phosphate synthase/cobalamin synthase
MNKFFLGFALAFSMLSIIPFFKVHNFYKGINAYAVLNYPFVGFLLGLILYGVYYLLYPFVTHAHLSIIIFALWVLITGAIHLDGYADTLDGLFVQKDKALQVMKDPNTGGMGMIFTVVFLMLKASSLNSLGLYYLLPIVLMLSRFNAVIAIYMFKYVSPNGMATLAKDEFSKKQFFITITYVLLIAILFSSFSLLLYSLLTLFFLQLFFIRRYGGFTGDIYGFSIEVTELILLNIIIFGLS